MPLFCWPFVAPTSGSHTSLSSLVFSTTQIDTTHILEMYNIREGFWWIGIPWGTHFGANGCAISICFTNPKHD